MALTELKLLKTVSRLFTVLMGILLITPALGGVSSYYAVQLAASKSPLDIQQFAKRHQIGENIREIVSDDWHRYVVGKFESLKTASLYAGELGQKTGISGAFPRKISEADLRQTSGTEQEQPAPQETAKTNPTFSNQSDSLPPTQPAARPGSAEKEERVPHKELNQLILRIVGDKNVTQTKRDLIEYGKTHFPVSIRKVYNRFIERTYTYPIILIFVIFTFFFIINVSLILFIIYNSNLYKNRKERYRLFYKNYYEEVLSLYLFDINDWHTTLSKLKKLKKEENRRILTSVLLIFKENLRGEMDAKITEIYTRLNLNQDSLKLTRSWFYFKKVQGIRELTNLDPESAKGIVSNFLNDKHFQTRTEAQVSYVRLHPENPFDFLKTLKSPFSPWAQLSAFYIFRLHQIPVPAFVNYIESAQTNVRNFCLRMIIFFQQFEDAEEIFKMVESKLESTRLLAIRAINDLRLYSGKPLLLKIYNSEPVNNQIEIIKALRNIGDDDDFGFLEQIIVSGSASQKLEACKSLFHMSRNGEMKLQEISKKHDIDFDLYLAHIKDSRN